MKKEKDYFLVILDVDKSDVACSIIKWMMNERCKELTHDRIYLLDYTISKQWDKDYLLFSERMPKVIGYLRGVPIPFEHIHIQSDIELFVEKLSKKPVIEDFILRTQKDVEDMLSDDGTLIKNVYFLYDMYDEDTPESVRDHMLAHLYSSLTTHYIKYGLVLKRKVGEWVSTLLSKKYKTHVPIPEDSSLISVSCGSPVYRMLYDIAKEAPGMTYYQLLKYASNIPYLEMDRTIAGMAGSNEEKSTKVFAVAVNVLDLTAVSRQVKDIEISLYCEFRGKIRFVWFDAFFNPARLQLLGIPPNMK